MIKRNKNLCLYKIKEDLRMGQNLYLFAEWIRKKYPKIDIFYASDDIFSDLYDKFYKTLNK